jgi:type I restriction enzyme M protein
MPPKPSWFSTETVLVSTAPTCGLTKGGRLLPLIDTTTGSRVQVADPDTGEMVDAINDELLADMQALHDGATTDTLRIVPAADVTMRTAVPVFYDSRYEEQFRASLATDEAMNGFTAKSLRDLIAAKQVTVRAGHGSPSKETRVGEVPYIKVSDLRAGTVNINPTNRVPRATAEKYWKGNGSGLLPYDLLSPERTSKNIGDFCVLMPGQEQVVLTKEVLILRPGPKAQFDAFYLLWALTLKTVREQWKRLVFMQTNREDVGQRYLELLIPVPNTRETADRVSEPFRTYYQSVAAARETLGEYLRQSGTHHFFVSGAEAPEVGALDAAVAAGEAIAEPEEVEEDEAEDGEDEAEDGEDVAGNGEDDTE